MSVCDGFFKKLSIQHEWINIENFDVLHALTENNRGILYGSSKRKLLKIVPEEYHHHFQTTCMSINKNYIPPHVDSSISTVINFYITTANATTTFWKAKPNFRRRKIPNQTDGYIVHDDDVEKVASFKAKPGEIWLLNVKEIHSVQTEDENSVRFANQLQTTLPYERVLYILENNDDIREEQRRL